MDQDPPELTLDESIKQVMQTLPPIIRAYLAQGTYTSVAKGLMSKYGLRIDQGGVLEREIMLLLMGIENPDDFTKALIEEAKLDQKTVGNIVQDINTQIFIPLREAEMKGQSVPQPAQPAQPARPPSVGVPRYVPPATVLPRQGSYAPPPQSPAYSNQQQDAVNAFVHRVQPSPLNNPQSGLSGEHSVERNVLASPPSVSVIKPPPLNNPPNGLSGNRSVSQNGLAPVQPTSPVQPQRPPPPPNLPGALPPKSDIVPPIPKAPPPPTNTDPYREPIA